MNLGYRFFVVVTGTHLSSGRTFNMRQDIQCAIVYNRFNLIQHINAGGVGNKNSNVQS